MKKRIVISVISTLLALLVLEGGLRTYYYLTENKFFGLTPARTTLVFYDNEVFGSALTPNQHGWFVPHTREYYTWIDVNSHGWPDVEHSYDKPGDTYRVVILGDSFVENTQVSFEKRFFHLLQNNLNARFPEKRMEIIAIGRGNTGTDQQYLILKNYALKYHPDLVIQMFLTGNDVRNNSATLQADPYLPYFKLNSANELEEVPHSQREKRPLASIKDWFKHLRLVELLLSARQQIQERKLHIEIGGYPIEYHVYDQNYSTEYNEAWNITKKVILATRDITLQNGAQYLFVTLANNEQVNKNAQNLLFKTYPPAGEANLDFEKPDKIINDFCTQEALTCWNMLPFYKQYIVDHEGAVTHNLYENHWNELGSKLASDFLTQKLEDYFIIK